MYTHIYIHIRRTRRASPAGAHMAGNSVFGKDASRELPYSMPYNIL